jgi:hypothetical protein
MTCWDKGKKKHNKWQKSLDQSALNLIQGSGVCMSFAPSSQRVERSRHTRLPARQEAGNSRFFLMKSSSQPSFGGQVCAFCKNVMSRDDGINNYCHQFLSSFVLTISPL